MSLRITSDSLNEIRDKIRFPLNVMKDKLNRNNPELFEELENQFQTIEEVLNKITNEWDIWDE